MALGWLIRHRYEAGSIGVGRHGGNDMADDKEEYTLLPRVVVLLISYSQYTKRKIRGHTLYARPLVELANMADAWICGGGGSGSGEAKVYARLAQPFGSVTV